MKKLFSVASIIIVICIPILASSLPSLAKAQSVTATASATIKSPSTPTPTPIPPVVSMPAQIIETTTNTNIVTFTQLLQSEIQLNGPYDERSFSFAVPADWQLEEGTQLYLSLGVAFNQAFQDQSNKFVSGGGTLTILLNNVVLMALPLSEIGEVETKIDIPLTTFKSNRSDGRMALRFVLESDESCYMTGQHTSIFIHPSSYFVLPHSSIKPTTNLINFPRPIFQNSFTPDKALLIIPDQPSAAELQAALTVAAGIGKLSFNRVLLDLTTLSNFQENLANSHLIFIGKAASLPILQSLKLPLPVTDNKFTLPTNNSDDGLVEMIDSPWSSSHVVLVISANTDQGLVQAAQATSTGVLQPSLSNNLAVIKEVNSIANPGLPAVNQTLIQLGYAGKLFESRGNDSEQYIFNIPSGMTVGPDANFELVFGHSAVIDYNSSQIVLVLNDEPIGSIRMSDATANLPTNHAKFVIPSSAIVPGKNILSVNVNIVPVDDCTPPTMQGFWVKIWPQSTLHLPLIPVSVDPLAPQDLASYPAPFIYHSELKNTAFVLEQNNLDSWRQALQIASFLGNQASGPIIALSVFYGDGISEEERSQYNLLLIGRPSQMPIMTELDKSLPVPFLEGSDIAVESNLQVTYYRPPDSPIGYLEMMLSPWDPNHVVLAVLGNTIQGVNWAATALLDSNLRYQLGGNFAVINDRQIITTNTGYSATTSEETNTELPDTVNEPVDVKPTQILERSQPEWILPVMGILITLIILIIMIVTVRNRSALRIYRNKFDHKPAMRKTEDSEV